MLHFAKPWLYALIFLCVSTGITASDKVFYPGAREAGMAGSSVSVPGLWAVYHNPAGLGYLTSASAGICIENHYQLEELNTASLAVVVPERKGSFGFSSAYFGTSRFNEQKFAFGYGRCLGEKLSAGVLLDCFVANLPENNGSSVLLAGEAGLLYKPLPKLNMGFHVQNPTVASYKNYNNEFLPVVFRAGASWEDKQFILSQQVQLNSRGETILSIGSEIKLTENLALRAGVSNSRQANYSMGAGYFSQHLSCDVAFSHHPVLGFSSALTLHYQLVRNNR
ncbi:MAG: hypothetical protein JXB34_14145 [Bacteroidales bacterium]|nr:hypothetical protein [Bacteroidales bacterium]